MTLARTADGVFWVARSMERMTNMARLIEVAHRMTAMSADGDEWRSSLIAGGVEPLYLERFEHVTPEQAANFLACHPDNPSSILNSLERARMNARAMRTALTRDAWDAVNDAWLEARALGPDAFGPNRLFDTLDWVKAAGARFLGATGATMLRTDTYYFIRLGTFIERADNTARILDVKYHFLLPSHSGVGGMLDYYHWTSILQAFSAVRAYHHVYKSEVKPRNVGDLLILSPLMPRSLRACYTEIVAALDNLAWAYEGARGEPHRLAGALYARLQYGRVDDIFQRGLHEYLTDMIDETAVLGAEIQAYYMR